VFAQVFNDHSRIWAIKTTGNVYSADAIEELNIKAKNFEDLMSGAFQH
jgi:peptidyl-prolyl cis-trans isomerase-like 2